MANDTDAKETIAVDEVDQSFNDAELEDIMSEIESLEKDFEETREDTIEATTNDMTAETTTDTAEVVATEVAIESSENIVEFKKNRDIASTSNTSPLVGNVNLSMSFEIAGEMAKVLIDGENGVCFEYKGNNININGNEGCVIELQGGAKLIIPLDNSAAGSCKKAS